MKPDILQKTTEYTKKHQRKKRWRRIVMGLASVVVFCTTYALILPAITLGEEQCGITEHTHTETCYTQITTVEEEQLVCTIDPEDYHEHTADCYDEEGNLICGQEEKPQHVHTDECYALLEVPADTETLTCGKEEGENHHHTALCYGTWELTCGMQEHTHTKACYADTSVDVESAEIWEQTMKDAPLTGEWRNDLLAVAQTQTGYRESQRNYIVLSDGETIRGYTRYGAWDGNPYEEWCASFISFCLHYADVPEETFPQDNNCVTWIETLQAKEYDLYQPAHTEAEDGSAEVYTPDAGDLVFFTWNQDDCADHVGIVTEVIPAKDGEPAKINTIEGNKSDEVKIQTYELDSEQILGYGILPEQHFTCGKKGHVHTEDCYDPDGNLTCETEEHIHTDICEAVKEGQEDSDALMKLTYSGSDYTVRVTYGEDAGLPEGTELQVKEIKRSSEQYEKYLEETEKILEAEKAEKVRFARFFDIEFVKDGSEVEPEAPVSVSITYDDEVDLSDPGNSQVIHFSENGPELLDAEAKNLKDDSTRFTHTQDSFSVLGDLVTVDVNYNAADAGPDSLPVDYYVCIDGEWTCVGTTKTGWYGDYTATGWTDYNRDYITTEQVASILGAYGFDASVESPARKIAYQQKNSDVKLYSDTNQVEIGGQKVIPLARNASHAGYNLYYLPNNTHDLKSITSPNNLDKAANTFYSVKVFDTSGKAVDAKYVLTGGSYAYTPDGTTNSWIVSYGDATTAEISGTTISLTNITSTVTVSPKLLNDTRISHSVTYKVMIDGQWQTVGTSLYYYSGSVDDQQRAYITSDMAAQFFGDYGFLASEEPGKNIGYSYNDIYKIYYAGNTGYCMDINGNTIANNTAVQLWTSNTSTAQIFRIWDAGDGYKYITPVENSAYHVNVLGGGTTDGTKLGIHTATDAASHWKVVTNSDGTTSFYNRNAPDSAVIDLPSGNVTNGNQLQIWSNGGNRYWKLVQQYRISNSTVSEQMTSGNWKIGLTAESNGDIVCYYLPAEADDLLSFLSEKSESEISTNNSFWSVSVRDDTNSVYSDGELSNMVQFVDNGGTATITVKNADGILWSVTGAGDENVTSSQKNGYTSFIISNITQPVEVVATKANPQFTVQYYANVPRLATSGGDAELPVIDTSGKTLPKNGVTPTYRQLQLEYTNSYTTQNRGDQTKLFQVKTTMELTKMYSDEKFKYETSPDLYYFNKLKDNADYSLKEIWILKAGSDPSSLNRNDWYVYTYQTDTQFTNEAGQAVGNTILINDGAVIRLVSDSSTGEYYNGTTFYDYNISSGQNADGKWRTGITGINSEKNYNISANGQRTWTSYCDVFAFGNQNCGTGMGFYLFDDGRLNAYNNKNGYGCTFSIAERLTEKGTIDYNDWIVVPNLFNDGDADYKQTYAGSSLTFNRVGDTYTLSSATLKNSNGQFNTIEELQYFFNPSPAPGLIYDSTYKYGAIYTNNFWPMDEAYGKTDPLWGEYGNTGTFQGFENSASGTRPSTDLAKEFPAGDDGHAHNWFFGMNFSISFNLTADYEGPLEYYFFGDDDMWVFLDDELVCDIGGVHSSVGEYVNLRDYLPVGSSGQHTLSFFYTERGASGSTCYMSFTLPSVSSAATAQDTGSLRISKTLEGISDDSFNEEEYRFKVELLTQEDGSALNQTFSYAVSDNKDETEDIYGTIKSGGMLNLKKDQSVTISGIPAGTFYRVTELTTEGYSVSVNNNQGYIASGTIATGEVKPASFVNTFLTYELPETGGAGTDMYIIGGLLLITSAGILLIYNQRKRRKEDQNLS